MSILLKGSHNFYFWRLFAYLGASESPKDLFRLIPEDWIASVFFSRISVDLWSSRSWGPWIAQQHLLWPVWLFRCYKSYTVLDQWVSPSIGYLPPALASRGWYGSWGFHEKPPLSHPPPRPSWRSSWKLQIEWKCSLRRGRADLAWPPLWCARWTNSWFG